MLKKALFLLPLVILFLHKGYILYKTEHWMNDDAFISFRYAENLAKGNGLVYNKGEKVEGYTNFLWVILLAPFMKLGFDPILISLILSLIFSLGTIIIFTKLSFLISFNPKSIFNLLAPIFLVLDGIYIGWGICGLEIDLYTFLAILSIWLLLKNSPYLPIALSLLSMTRPDGFIFTGCIFLYKMLKEKSLNLKFILIFSLIYFPYFLWRYSYYGFLFPNSFYAKVGSGFNQYRMGYLYFKEFLLIHGGIFLLPIFLILIKKREILCLLGIFTTYSLYIIYVGGDYWPGGRYFVPIIPLLYLLFKESLLCIYNWSSSLRYLKIAIFLMLGALSIIIARYAILNSFSGPFYKLITEHRMDKDGRIIGEYLRQKTKPNETLATNTAGTIAYYSKLKVIDMLGINDLHIAHKKRKKRLEGWCTGHEKYDGAYVFSRKPEYIILGYSSITGPMLPSDVVICDIEEFITNYEPIVVPIRLSNAPCFIYYKRLPISSKDSLLEKEIQKEIKIDYQPIENIKAMEMIWDCGGRLFKRGGLFFNKRRIDWAILEWEKAIALNVLNPSNLVQAHYWLGVSYLRKGRKEEARLQFKKVLEKEPNNKDALSILENMNIQKMR